MTLQITWIAHGATAAVRRAAFPGDEPLEAKARAKAAGLAGTLGRAALGRADQVLVAPERRAQETADALGLTGTTDGGLRDCDHGRWAGCSLAELQAEAPAALAAWLSDPAANPHGGESIADLIRRVAAWSDSPDRGEGRVLALTHPAVMRAAVVHALGANPTAYWRIDVAPLSRLILSRHGASWRLQALEKLTP
jgi:broad specificity phosphatase PhoE